MRTIYTKIIISIFIFVGVMNMAGCASLKIGTNEKAKGLENTRKLGVEINGALNGMFITSTDEKNPVLLFISGGPGVPEIWLNEVYADKYPNKLSEHFTVCYWDYIGEGLSYNKKIFRSLENLLSDPIYIVGTFDSLNGKTIKESIFEGPINSEAIYMLVSTMSEEEYNVSFSKFIASFTTYCGELFILI